MDEQTLITDMSTVSPFVDRQVSLRPTGSAAEWNSLVSANHGCFFHLFEWLETMARDLGLSFRPEVVLAEGRPVGVAPLLVKRLGPFTTVNILSFPYVGPLVPPELLPSVLRILADLERRLLSVYSQHVLMYNAGIGAVTGYQETLDRTFVLDLRDQTEETLLYGIEAKRRGKVRRAMKAGVVIRPATRQEVCESLPAWSDATFADQGLPAPYPASSYEAVWQRFSSAEGARFSTAVVDGRPVCVQVTLADRTRAVGWAMASDKADRGSSLALPLLYFDTFRWALRRGCAEFDLVGAPTEGVARYKQDWGAQQQVYSVLRREAVLHRIAMRLLKR